MVRNFLEGRSYHASHPRKKKKGSDDEEESEEEEGDTATFDPLVTLGYKEGDQEGEDGDDCDEGDDEGDEDDERVEGEEGEQEEAVRAPKQKKSRAQNEKKTTHKNKKGPNTPGEKEGASLQVKPVAKSKGRTKTKPTEGGNTSSKSAQ